jgi:hypothetical protein
MCHSTRVRLAPLVLLLVASRLGAQWTSSGNLQGGPITAFVGWKNEVFVGTADGGVFRSGLNDGGWSRMNDGLGDTRVLTLAVKESSLYAGTSGGGVFVSSLPGGRWVACNDGLADSVVQFLLVHGEDILAGTLGGVCRSTNGGATWKIAGEGLNGIPVRVLAAAGSLLIAGTNGDGVYVSTDDGAAWTSASEGLANTSLFSLACIGSHIFAGTYGGMFRGIGPIPSWIPMLLSGPVGSAVTGKRPGVPALQRNSERADRTAPKTVYSLAALGGMLYVGTYGMGVLCSGDLGASWSPFNPGLQNLSLYVLRVVDDRLFAGSFDGEVWSYHSTTAAPTLPSEGPEAASGLQAWSFPNPFNATATIAYGLPVAGAVRIELFASDGSRVAVLLDNEMQSPGNHEVVFDASYLASGVYFCRLFAGERHRTLRLVMTK